MSVTGVGFSNLSVRHPSDASMPANIRAQAVNVEMISRSRNKINPQTIQSATADLQRIGNAFNKKLKFEVDHSSNEVIVKVIDKETDKVIKELPPEELQRLHRNIREAIGLLFDEMA